MTRFPFKRITQPTLWLVIALIGALFTATCRADTLLGLSSDAQEDVQNMASSPGGAAGQASTNVSVIVPQSVSPTTTGQPGVPAQNAGDMLKRRPAFAGPDQFQRFVEVTTGRRLPHFGKAMFDGPPSTFAPVQDIPVPHDYVIGPGDELVIRIWGNIELNTSARVDRNGQISLSKVGVLSVTGIKASDIESYLHAKVSRLYKGFSLSATLGQLRSIQVYVVGHAASPGAYTVSPFSTLVSALFASGGPGPTGSMRRVQLKRHGGLVTEFDLYDFLVKGDKSGDVPLLAGDVLLIPPAGPRVAVIGAFHQPAIYELRAEGETVNQVLAYGGGLPVTAMRQTALIERIAPDKRGQRGVKQIDLSTDGQHFVMHDGDLLTLMPISTDIANAVTLRGSVALPSRYPFVPGMRISDLIPDKQALLTSDYYRKKNALVGYEHGYLLGSVEGKDKERPEELVQRLNDEINWNYAVIERLNAQDLSTELIPFNLGKAVLEGDPKENVQLRPGDVVTVFSKRDVQVPQSRTSRLVRLEGEVMAPGVYQALPGESLRQLIQRAGGVTPDAYLYGAQLNRISVQKEQEKRWLENVNRLAQEVERSAAEQAQEGTDPTSTVAKLQAQRQLVERLREMKPTGRIALEMTADRSRIIDLPDLLLEDGDRLFVPSRPAYVSVLGQVYNPGTFVYRQASRVADYLAQTGGPTQRGDDDEIYVVHANGTVSSNAGGSWLGGSLTSSALMPGDTIFVPEQLEVFSWRKELKDWTSILYQFGLGAAALKTIRD